MNTVDAPPNAPGARAAQAHPRGSRPTGADRWVCFILLQNLLGLLDVSLPFDTPWTTLPLLPATGVLAQKAWLGYRTVGRPLTAEVRHYVVSAAALATTTVGLPKLSSIVFVYVALTGVMLVGGLIAAIPRRRTVVRETLTTRQPTRPTPGVASPSARPHLLKGSQPGPPGGQTFHPTFHFCVTPVPRPIHSVVPSP